MQPREVSERGELSGWPSGAAMRLGKPPLERWLGFLDEFRHHIVGMAGALIIGFMVLTAIFGPSVIRASPFKTNVAIRMAGSSWAHPLGTDELGRDTLSRLVWGSRVSMTVGIIAVGIALIIGCAAGLVAGYFGGVTDGVIMRIVDAMMAFPGIVLAITIVAVLGPGIEKVMISLGIVASPSFARLLRASVLSVREQVYVGAAQAIGASNLRIMVHHIWPNANSPLIVSASLLIGFTILAEAGLSFLGIGITPPNPTWGSMLRTGTQYLRESSLLVIWPGLAIFITVLGFNFLGDGLRDVMDPRLRGLLGTRPGSERGDK